MDERKPDERSWMDEPGGVLLDLFFYNKTRANSEPNNETTAWRNGINGLESQMESGKDKKPNQMFTQRWGIILSTDGSCLSLKG